MRRPFSRSSPEGFTTSTSLPKAPTDQENCFTGLFLPLLPPLPPSDSYSPNQKGLTSYVPIRRPLTNKEKREGGGLSVRYNVCIATLPSPNGHTHGSQFEWKYANFPVRFVFINPIAARLRLSSVQSFPFHVLSTHAILGTVPASPLSASTASSSLLC